MNKQRRKELQEAIDLIANMAIESVSEIVRQVLDEEHEALESLEENFPGTERAEKATEMVDALEEVADRLEEIDLDEIAASISTVIES